MLPYATPAICAQLDPYEERERDTLRSTARARLSSPARAGAQIALAICEVEAGLRSPLQLERRCHLSLWPKLSARLRRSGGPAVPVGSLVRVVAQEHVPALADVLVVVRRGGRVVAVAMRLDGAKGRWSWSSSSTDHRQGSGAGRAGKACARPCPLPTWAPTYPQALTAGVVVAAGLAIVGSMSRTECLTERAISFAIAEADEDLAVARLAFLAQGDHAALDAAIDACLARTDRTLYTRWRAISLLVRVRYEDQPVPEPSATASAGRSNGGKGRAPGSPRGPVRDHGRPERRPLRR